MDHEPFIQSQLTDINFKALCGINQVTVPSDIRGDKNFVVTRYVSSIILIGRVLCEVTPAMLTWGLSPDVVHRVG